MVQPVRLQPYLYGVSLRIIAMKPYIVYRSNVAGIVAAASTSMMHEQSTKMVWRHVKPQRQHSLEVYFRGLFLGSERYIARN